MVAVAADPVLDTLAPVVGALVVDPLLEGLYIQADNWPQIAALVGELAAAEEPVDTESVVGLGK